MRIPAMLSLCTAVLLSCAQRGASCDCVPPTDVGEAFSLSDAVFTGRVTYIGDRHDKNGALAFREYMFRVSRGWKGTGGIDTAILYDIPESTCSFIFEDGKQYLVYASGDRRFGGRLSTSICTRTRLLEDAADDLGKLGKPAYLGRWLRE